LTSPAPPALGPARTPSVGSGSERSTGPRGLGGRILSDSSGPGLRRKVRSGWPQLHACKRDVWVRCPFALHRIRRVRRAEGQSIMHAVGKFWGESRKKSEKVAGRPQKFPII